MNYSRIRYNVNYLFCLIMMLSACKEEKPTVSKEKFDQTNRQLIEVNKILVRKDRQMIKGFIDRHQLEMQESETGLWYTILDKGDGIKAESGRKVTINFRIGLLDGTECYNSTQHGPKTFLIGRGGVESGLEEGILMLNAGGKAKFIMPPHLAHGLPGDGDKIPARAIIVYDVEVLSIE